MASSTLKCNGLPLVLAMATAVCFGFAIHSGIQLFATKSQQHVGVQTMKITRLPRVGATSARAAAQSHVTQAGAVHTPQMPFQSQEATNAAWTTVAFVLAPVCAFLAVAAQSMKRHRAGLLWADLEAPLALAMAGMTGRKVAVTGAGGRTGKLVVQKLLERPEYTPICVLKSDKAAQAVKKLGVDAAQIRTVSVTDGVAALTEAFAGCEAVVLCSSAVPKIKLLSIAKIFFKKCFGREPGRPEFTFPEGGSPEEVDWIGTKNQVDAAKAAGVKHFIMVSSMGGTQPDNFLNTIGKKPDGTGGDILLWKRKGERYLIDSGLTYTIVHPGGLLDQPGGQREIVFGVDDTLLKETVRSIPRADVAEVCVQALGEPGARNRSFDIISKPEKEGTPTTNFAAFFANQGNCDYSL